MPHTEGADDRKTRQGDRKTTIKKPILQLVRGTPFAPAFLRECIESAMDYAHREGDLFIVTYMKCGTTWLQHIVYLTQNGGVPPVNAAELYGASPYFEACGAECVRWTTRPGAIKCHLPLHQTGYSPEARYIVGIRNPFDTVVSLHYFWRMISSYEYDGEFDDSFENFVAGTVDSRDYFDFYKGWCRRIDDPNVLFLVYEDMRKDPEAAVLKVAKFLGPEYEESLLADDGRVLKDVLRYSSFEEMKKYTNKMIYDFYEAEFPFRGEEYRGLRHVHETVRNGCGSAGGDGTGSSADKIDYVRNGVVGDWRNYFSSEQVRRMSEKFQRETCDTVIAYLWPELNIGSRESERVLDGRKLDCLAKAAAVPLLLDVNHDYTVRLKERVQVTHNTRLLRFELPSENQVLGCAVGQHVYLWTRLGERLLVRPYTPVSPRDQRGSFDIIVKVYRQATSSSVPDGGIMSQTLDSLMPGDPIQVQGPKGEFEYVGGGRFIMENGSMLCLASHIGLVAAGSGVTPMLQLLRHKFADPNDVTRIFMINVNHSEKDIIMHQELKDYAKHQRRTFRLCNVLTEMPVRNVLKKTHEDYVAGPLTQSIMEEYLPPPSSYSIILICGPPRMISELCQPALRNIGHDRLRVLVY
ncbi:uncharacterized protein [Dermacentor andersoni]|uniref:uncharacterized protein n=1 Tax=Dermacentor andersoni TaxID=34620 RepID=UPI003B3AEC75